MTERTTPVERAAILLKLRNKKTTENFKRGFLPWKFSLSTENSENGTASY